MTATAPWRRARAVVLVLWAGLLLVLTAWLLTRGAASVALLPLTAGPMLLPVTGLWRGRRRTYRWAPLTLAPVLAWSLTETLANPPARTAATLCALLAFLALAAIVATLRSMPAHH